MSTGSTLPSVQKPNALKAILWGGFLCGALDITTAFVVYGFYANARPIRMLKGIASGLLGPERAQAGGLENALLGLLCHFFIAFSAATVYYLISRRVRFLVNQAIVSGVLYGTAVYFFMNRVVVPLSHARRNPFSFKFMVIGVLIHIFCVGLPISLSIRRFSK